MTRRLEDGFGSTTPLAAIEREDVENFIARLGREDLASGTVDKYARVAHGVFSHAQRAYNLANNPAHGVERPPVKRSGDIDFLAPAELDALLAAATSEQDKAIFAVAGYAGLRLGEVRGLEWGDVDFPRQRIFIRRSYTHNAYGLPKSGKIRSVPMADQIVGHLDRLSRRPLYTASDDLVFANEVGAIIDESALRRRFKKALTAAKLRKIRFHDLRHSFGTNARMAGFDLIEIKEMMGHADLSTVMVYQHYRPRQGDAAKLTKGFQARDDFAPDFAPSETDTQAGEDH
jgi:integrase